jgi:hypothetical protein
MRSIEFIYWLQGFFELSESNTLSEKQVEIVKNHLKLVFYHEIDPSYSSDPQVQEEMQMIHDGRTNITGELLTNRTSIPLVKPEPPEDRVLIEGKRPQTPPGMRGANFNNRGLKSEGKVKC